MKFSNIEVNGIKKVVINRKHWWVKVGPLWKLAIRGPEPDDFIPVAYEGKTLTHEEMMKMVSHLKKDRRYRLWVHLDTLNIIRRTGKPQIVQVAIYKCNGCEHGLY